MICGSKLWLIPGPFVQGDLKPATRKEIWDPQMVEIQGTAGPKESMALAQNDTVISGTLVQNVKENTEVPTVDPARISTPKAAQNPQSLPTPIKYRILSDLLTGYDKDEVKFLISGFELGFSLGYQGERISRKARNLVSCHDKPEEVQKKLQKEIALGRIAGPFVEPPFQDGFIISPIGVVPKGDTDQFRLIQNLSFPENCSINDGIMGEFKTVNYASIDDAISKLKINGSGAFMSKTDIDSAFRLIPVNPEDYPILGIKFNNRYYYDRCLPMGCSSSCHIFERFSTDVEWIATNKFGIESIIHYLDDFLIVGPANSNQCQTDLKHFLGMCERIGVPIKAEKTVQPSTVITFLGIELDSVSRVARLPQAKLNKIQRSIEVLMRKTTVSLKDVQSVIGLLNFACQVITPGRPFLRRLIALTMGIQNPRRPITLDQEARLDLSAWLLFIKHFNGTSMFLHDRWIQSTKLHFYTDSSGAIGFAAVFGNHWFNGAWDESWTERDISIKEMFPVVIALEAWGHLIKNHCICFHIDNLAVVNILNKQSAKDPVMMILVRRFVLASMKFNILFKAIHISTHLNVSCDALSRFQMERFREASPKADIAPWPLPKDILKIT